MKKFRNTLFLAAWLIIVLLASNTGVLVSIFSPEEKEQERVEEDPFMTTGSYQVSLKDRPGKGRRRAPVHPLLRRCGSDHDQ